MDIWLKINDLIIAKTNGKISSFVSGLELDFF